MARISCASFHSRPPQLQHASRLGTSVDRSHRVAWTPERVLVSPQVAKPRARRASWGPIERRIVPPRRFLASRKIQMGGFLSLAGKYYTGDYSFCSIYPLGASAFRIARVRRHDPRPIQAQFGLYTEGYTRLLASVADAMATSPEGVLVAADLRRRMSIHISGCVFARQDRVEGLLKRGIWPRSARRSLPRKRSRTPIDSSLGPNWYKEDQFSLILDALTAVDDPEFSRLNWKPTIEVLAYASGESNFQRYVRDAKGSLIRPSLPQWPARRISGVRYLHYLIPSYELQALRVC